MADERKTDETEAAAVRRRWINIGEAVAVAAVLISALTFWNSYSERRNAEEARQSEQRSAAAKARTIVLKATAQHGGDRLSLAPIGEQTIQGQTIAFPSALGLEPVETVSDPRIEAGWFEKAVKKARRDAGRDEDEAGDERLPIAITTRYYSDGALLTDISLYDVGYRMEGRFLRGSELKLKGLSLIGRTGAKQAQARLDTLWKARQPTISSGLKK
jgi:hypothetical protein